eukprot:NODE_3895_length_1965_cov_6.330794.p1 GENE.NODE_3895_length_1965_cov_6.330794~~NODE_3895_length_1965_cov_6.330794.p1  ORF type:complete len:596 (-),score=184.89 NODE_3895_length_1965_cov_6.330794:178-1842(-)
MEIEVANGAWRHGAVLSVRVGDVQQHVPLGLDTCLSFPTKMAEAGHVRVDVLASFGTKELELDPSEEIYELDVEGGGFTGLALRIRPTGDAVAEDRAVAPVNSRPARPLSSGTMGSDRLGLRSPCSQMPSQGEAAEERVRQTRQEAQAYIERFDLRGVVQGVFRSVIRERPEAPFGFMREYLRRVEGTPAPDDDASLASLAVLKANVNCTSPAYTGTTYAPSPSRLQQARIEVLEQRIRELEAAAVVTGVATGTSPLLGGGQAERERTLADGYLASAPAAAAAVAAAEASATGDSSLLPGGERGLSALSQLLSGGDGANVPPQLAAATYDANALTACVEEEDEAPLLDAGILVEVVDCPNEPTNGVYVCVGSYSDRPMYRLLSQEEPRYLYCTTDAVWAGWWISDEVGSTDFIEWFRHPACAMRPAGLSKGEQGSRVIEVPLTSSIIDKVEVLSDVKEKTEIRGKLLETFGPNFSKLDSTQMVEVSPVAGVAQTLEAQQRTIRLLHTHLATMTKRCEAAEVHSRTMQDAFEKLHLEFGAHLAVGTELDSTPSFS